MSSHGKLAGRRALVTGSGTGIGREIALEFARQGADVVLHYAHSDTGAAAAVAEIRALGRRAEVFPANFDSVDAVGGLAARAIEFLGGIDCLVNNSGITLNKPFLQVTPEQFDLLYHVNVRAQFFLIQAVVRDMLTHGGGTICNLTSIHGLQGAPEHSVYAGTKGAIIAQTRTLGIELAHKGIRLNAIAPGWTRTERVDEILRARMEQNTSSIEEEAAKITTEVPLRRMADPVEFARAATFLLSPAASYISGVTLLVDGGMARAVL